MPFLQALRNVVTPEMDHEVIESKSFEWSTRIIDILATLTIGCILCLHCWTIIRHHHSSKHRPRGLSASAYEIMESWTLALNSFTILYIVTQFILLLGLTFNIWQVLPVTLDCSVIVLVLVTLYHFSKSVFYAILITRLQVAFYLSSLKYSNHTIIALYVFVTVYCIFVCVGTPFLIYGVWVTHPVNWCHIHTRETLLASIAIALWICLDVLICVALCYLFLRPIKQISELTTHGNSRFNGMYIKYALLTYISIFLNMLSLLVYLFDHLTILIEITAAINCVCVVLMHAKYERLFKHCCGCLVKRCVKRLERKRKANEVKSRRGGVQLAVKDQSSTTLYSGDREKLKQAAVEEEEDEDYQSVIPVDGGVQCEKMDGDELDEVGVVESSDSFSDCYF
eukprot:CAMPEP_0197024664 /NCGR_PEP_ID=MMETSP1384-20130603/5166_1 /TAXON_ID=29189 /ORGANISM="Ammonia sp." /LENGTH=395 /DNA_ID=CAMNT_0042453081 /DNA_START=51 /DNA_END=1238 /DNA_ORIENTATION=-